MLAANIHSTNNDSESNETIPITNPNRQNSSALRQFTNLFRTRNSPERADPEGYVEFGGMSHEQPNQEQRTLGTFAGCFAPVSLSMFSALVFIR
jgi:solute carrier family 12 (potassium/chloride transporters), member 9